jgi:lysophospholipase L1-like esterase
MITLVILMILKMNSYLNKWRGGIMKKKIKIMIRVIAIFSIITIVWLGYCGFEWSWGPFCKLHDLKTKNLAGNNEKYAVENVEEQTNSLLAGKRICFLGSSVTYGAASMGESFVDFLRKRDGIVATKDAVSGTTLVDQGTDSYIERLKKLDKNMELDLFVCQLSTNDATQNKFLGNISDSKDLNAFDKSTITGAIEYIIAYSQETWDCPVVFYTNPQYDNENYQKMVERLLQLQQKWDIGVINMWDNPEFNQISEKERTLYMADAIHPTKAGYLLWWTPYMEKYLIEYKK